jgi:hypothetical protein
VHQLVNKNPLIISKCCTVCEKRAFYLLRFNYFDNWNAWSWFSNLLYVSAETLAQTFTCIFYHKYSCFKLPRNIWLRHFSALTVRSIGLQTDGVKRQPVIRFWFRWIISSQLAGLQGGNGKKLADEIRFLSPAWSVYWKGTYILTGSSVSQNEGNFVQILLKEDQCFVFGGKRSVITQV